MEVWALVISGLAFLVAAISLGLQFRKSKADRRIGLHIEIDPIVARQSAPPRARWIVGEGVVGFNVRVTNHGPAICEGFELVHVVHKTDEVKSTTTHSNQLAVGASVAYPFSYHDGYMAQEDAFILKWTDSAGEHASRISYSGRP